MKSFVLILTFLFGLNPMYSYSQAGIQDFAPRPPLGFNSFDSYKTSLNEEQAYALIDAMAEKYLPFGYEYFVMDAGWYSAYIPEKHEGAGRESFGLYVVHPPSESVGFYKFEKQ
jgi:hypothetical protein